MKTITLYGGERLVHARNPYGSHSWMLPEWEDEEGNEYTVMGNVAVACALVDRYPGDKLIDHMIESFDLGDTEAAIRGIQLGDQRFYLSIGKRCRTLQIAGRSYDFRDALARLRNWHKGRCRYPTDADLALARTVISV